MSTRDSNSIEVNITDLEREIIDLENRLRESKIVLTYARRQRANTDPNSRIGITNTHSSTREIIHSPRVPSLGIEKSDIDYLHENLIQKSNKRIALYKKVIQQAGRPLRYTDFCARVNQLGDDIKADSFYFTIRRVALRHGLKAEGNGYFALSEISVTDLAREIFGN